MSEEFERSFISRRSNAVEPQEEEERVEPPAAIRSYLPKGWDKLPHAEMMAALENHKVRSDFGDGELEDWSAKLRLIVPFSQEEKKTGK